MIPYINLDLHIDGKIISIRKKSVYRLLSYHSFESLNNDIKVVNTALIDGGYITANTIPPRTLTIRFAVDNMDLTENLRQYLIRTFAPRKQGILYAERNGVKRRINFTIANQVQYDQPFIQINKLKITINLICEDPYFLDENDTVSRFRIFEPLINAPFIFLPEGAGLTAGMQVVTDGIQVNNAGDADFGIRAEITVIGGDVVNPAIWRGDNAGGTGAYVRVITTLRIGDVMVIDTRRGNKGIWVKTAGTGELIKVLRYDPTSTWFTLAQGGNFVSFKADDGAEKAETKITYSNRWLGV